MSLMNAFLLQDNYRLLRSGPLPQKKPLRCLEHNQPLLFY